MDNTPAVNMQEIYKGMDYIANITYINLYSSASHNNRMIFLDGFNPKDTEHRYLLSIAHLVEQLGFGQIEIVGHPLFCFFYNLKNKQHVHSFSKKKFDFYQRTHVTEIPSCNELLDYMRPALIDRIPIDDIDFGYIYNQYFKKGKKK